MDSAEEIEKLNYILKELNERKGNFMILPLLKHRFPAVTDNEAFLCQQKLKTDGFIDIVSVSSDRKIAKITDSGREHILKGGYRIVLKPLRNWNVQINPKKVITEAEIHNSSKDELGYGLEIIKRLKEKYWRANYLSGVDRNSILTSLKEVVTNIFGVKSVIFEEFKRIESERDEDRIKDFTEKLEIKITFEIKRSENLVKEIKLYSFTNIHPKIKEVAEDLFSDGHYADSISQASKLLINEIKRSHPLTNQKSNANLDGTTLMDRVFSKNNPLSRFSDDMNYQEGMMYLYKGMVLGLRNRYQHENVKINNPEYAFEIICFISALLRLFENPKIY